MLPISATGKQRGFTLLELMLTLLLIGLTVGMVALNLPGRQDNSVANEALRLYQRLHLLEEKAVFGVSDYGLRVDAGAYRFFRLEGDAWTSLDDDPQLSAHTLPTNLRLTLRIEGQIIDLTPRAAAPAAETDTGTDSDSAASGPQVLLLSDGQITPFSLQLRATDGDKRFVVDNETTGSLGYRPVEKP